MTRKPDDWMPLHIGKYLADTTHLTRDQHGAYLLLLMAYWRRGGPLPAEDGRLAAIAKATPAEWRKLKPALAEFFTLEDGCWVQKRAQEELVKANAMTQAKAEAGRKGAAAKWQKDGKGNGKGMAQPSPCHRQTDAPIPSPEPIPEQKQEEGLACGAASQPPSAALIPFIEIPTNRYETTGEQHPIYEPLIEEYQRLYPSVEVRAELRKMRGWALSNPRKCKTKRGMKAFVNSWLARQQDKPAPRETFNGGRNGGQPTHQSFASTVSRVVDDRAAGSGLFGGPGEASGDADGHGDQGGAVIPAQISWQRPDAA